MSLADGSSLADIRQAIGVGVSQRQGKGTDSLDWLCYTVSDAAPMQRLWLTSSELARGHIDAVVATDLPAELRSDWLARPNVSALLEG